MIDESAPHNQSSEEKTDAGEGEGEGEEEESSPLRPHSPTRTTSITEEEALGRGRTHT